MGLCRTVVAVRLVGFRHHGIGHLEKLLATASVERGAVMGDTTPAAPSRAATARSFSDDEMVERYVQVYESLR